MTDKSFEILQYWQPSVIVCGSSNLTSYLSGGGQANVQGSALNFSGLRARILLMIAPHVCVTRVEKTHTYGVAVQNACSCRVICCFPQAFQWQAMFVLVPIAVTTVT